MPGELFFALRGEHLDGHEFAADAIERGAAAAVVSRALVARLPDAALAVPLLIAEDPSVALQALASHVRRQWGKRVIAVTGSSGKTTTVEAIAAALRAKFNVFTSSGDLNHALALSCQLLHLEPEHEFAVVEMGMKHIGEIGAIARVVAPDWGVVTNVGTAHIENFSEAQAGIARAKFELVAALPSNGIAFLNCDDAYVSQFGRGFQGRVVYFGAGPCADPQIFKVTEDLDGLHIRYRAGDSPGELTLQMMGEHNAPNAMAALAVALEAGVDIDSGAAALASFTLHQDRAQIIRMRKAVLIDESGNSNPEALRSMIHTLATRPARRRILIAGEMIELGEHSQALHAACGKAAAEAAIDIVVGVHANAEHLAAAACTSGVAALFLPDAEAAGRWLQKNLREGDVVLVMGSRGVQLERTIDMAKNSPERSEPQ
jgi:UDP-N-acetylmuramoyl-tripeptide--D-alanyl-D-alanine ligase